MLRSQHVYGQNKAEEVLLANTGGNSIFTLHFQIQELESQKTGVTMNQENARQKPSECWGAFCEQASVKRSIQETGSKI